MTTKNSKPDNSGETGRDNNGRFLPGHNGVGGRPRANYILLTDDLRREIENPSEINPNLTHRQQIIKSWLYCAEKGDMGALREILTRIDGPSGELSGVLELILTRGKKD